MGRYKFERTLFARVDNVLVLIILSVNTQLLLSISVIGVFWPLVDPCIGRRNGTKAEP